jgi:hypothetical protein
VIPANHDRIVSNSSASGQDLEISVSMDAQKNRERIDAAVDSARPIWHPASMAVAPPNQRDGWRPARLLSVAGIRGQEEQEQRATSSLLAVMHAVPEFAHALLAGLGAPKATPECFTEIPFSDRDGKKVSA